MNTAWSVSAALWPPLQGLWRALRGRRPQASPPQPTPTAVWAGRAGRTPLPAPTPRRLPVARPLRVVRVLEAGQPRSHTGRIVISGRMADVCAELDRLAACEAARS